MTDKFKVGDLVVYVPTTGQIISSQISKIRKIEDGNKNNFLHKKLSILPIKVITS